MLQKRESRMNKFIFNEKCSNGHIGTKTWNFVLEDYKLNSISPTTRFFI